MRKLILPVALLAVGSAAALPFRKAAPSASVPTTEADQSAVNVPAVVTPLNEVLTETAEQQTPADLVLNQFRGKTPAENPYEIPALQLPSSYSEIAIPLAAEARTNNLLRPSTSPPVEDKSEVVRRSRYGIPSERAQRRTAPGNLVVQGNWSTPQPLSQVADQETAGSETLVTREPATTLTTPASVRTQADAGVLTTATSDGQTAPNVGDLPEPMLASGEQSYSAPPFLTGNQAGTYNPVKPPTGKMAVSPPEARGMDLGMTGTSAHSEDELPAPRQRYFIREPSYDTRK